ncbi:MAG: 50S ribosomal protein L29 [Nitrospirota bacterium]|nr:50S ribosomal protein L29 [Nitrospirota bacterium]
MGPQELRKKDVAGLQAHEAELRKELFNLRFQAVTGGLSNPSRPGEVRREIARVLTLIKEKEARA